jgi:hypothetical protein
MSTPFEIPEWLFQAAPPSTPVDDHRVEALVNHFIARKQDALFTAPDAFYRLQAPMPYKAGRRSPTACRACGPQRLT